MKKIFIFLMIFIFILSINLSFAENNTDVLMESIDDVEFLGDSSDIYVSNEGSDSFGDGSIDNPYKTLNYTINKVPDGSNIHLKSGVYNSNVDIDRSILITGDGDVLIDASSNQKIFKINQNSTLKLSNIKFINGFCDLEGEILSPIINDGELVILNSSFDNFTTIMGAIKNTNKLTLENIKVTNSNVNKSPYGGFVTNIGECRILNSNIISSIYNNGNLNINDSYIDIFMTGQDYTTYNITTIVDKSKIGKFNVINSYMLNISNSIIDCKNYHTISGGHIYFCNSTFNYNNENTNYLIKFGESNLTAVSCLFNNRVDFASNSNINVTYSTFLDGVTTNYYTNAYLNHNWWGDNKGPKIYKNQYSYVVCDDWIVMALLNESNYIIKVDFSHYTTGDNINDLEKPYLFTPRHVKFEAESGHFNQTTGYLYNAVLKTKLLNANANTMIYATVDNQILRLAIGEGLTNYTWYISDRLGNDYFCDGTKENPFKTLKKAISTAFSGNTIYINEGVYTLSWNANLKISKSLTIVGFDGALLSRPNNRNIFIIDDKGELNIYNLSFTTYTNDFNLNPLILVNGGKLNIKNSKFFDIIGTDGIISCQKQGININLDNVTFDNIGGLAIFGYATSINVNNSIFINSGKYSNNYFISVKSDLNIFNSRFENNTQNIISTIKDGYSFNEISKITISNTIFKNNDWHVYNSCGLSVGGGIYNDYAIIDNCQFINNKGHLIQCNVINNSTFINNSAIPYSEVYDEENYAHFHPNSLIQVKNMINNSYFENNSFLSKSYEESIIKCPNVYYSSFINNSAAFGGALNGPNEVHYCVFVNNTGIYGVNDIFLYNGNLDASSNWWGSNQKPDDKRIQVFIGNLTINDWVIMTVKSTQNKIIASLDTLLDNDRNYHELKYILPTRSVNFSTEYGLISPNTLNLVDNVGESNLVKNTTKDFDLFAQIDNQIMSLRVYNNSTKLLIKNQTFYGKNNHFNITLINVNGHKISNQELNIEIRSNGKIIDSYILNTNVNGESHINIDYPVGSYEIVVSYMGNGYFEKTSEIALINISNIQTILTSYNSTYWGKNNKFYATLVDQTGKYILNETLTLKIFNINNKLINTINVKTGTGGRGDVLLSLDIGEYRLTWNYLGSEWYSPSSSESFIEINPINTTITLPTSTLYGKGNDYKLTFKDSYGTLISDEVITLKISNTTDSKIFNLKTDKGVASININLLPGVYNLEAIYAGDDVYGHSTARATLTIKPVFVTLDFNSHPELPINGIFTVIVKDMYGKKVANEVLTLELYDDGLIKTYTATSNAAGEADFRIDAVEGKYFGIINYNGNIWYGQTTGASTITISHEVVINNVYINGNDFVAYYGENKYYTIDFNDSNAYSLEDKVINVLISSKNWSKTFEVLSDIFGKARLQIALEPGIYNITYKYSNDYYNIYAKKSSSIIIYKMPTTLTTSNMVINVGQTRNFEVKLANDKGNGLANLVVNVNIDGVEYNITTNQNGIAKLLVNLDLGLHNVTCSFSDENYEKSISKSSILVVDSVKTATNLESSDIKGVENESIVLESVLTDLVDSPLAFSEITLQIGSQILTSYTDSNGVAKFSFKLPYGDYQGKLKYNGNDVKLESYKTVNIHVKPKNTIQTILYGNDCEIINADNNTNYFVVLTNLNGEFIKNQTIEFKVNNLISKALTDNNGRAYLNIGLKPGSYEIIATFNGSNNMTKASIVNYISVYGNLINLYSQDIIKSYNNETHYYVGLTDANNKPLADKTIQFHIDGKIYESKTNDDGLACFEIWLTPGEYEIIAKYDGYSVKNSITVLKTIYTINTEEYWQEEEIISVQFLDSQNNFLEKTNVYLIYDNKVHTLKTDEYGMITLNINLNSGTHKFIAVNPETCENQTFTVKILPTIISKNMIKYYGDKTKFIVKLINSNGKVLKNTKFKITINKKTYTLKTGKDGKARINVNLKPGKYKIIIYNTKTGEKRANTITIKSTILTKNKSVKSSKKTNFKIKILNSKGKTVKKAKIKVKVAKKTYTLKTNKKGIATLNIKLKKGNYKVITSYKGLKVTNKIKVVR